MEGISDVVADGGRLGRLRTGGGERRRGETGHRGLSRGCSDFWGPDARAVDASDAVGRRVGIVEEARVAAFCVAAAGLLVRLRVGLVSCPLFLRDRIVGVAEADGCADCFGNVGDEVDEEGCAGVDAPEMAAAVATFIVLCERAEGRAGDGSRDANGDALAEVAADADGEACVVCFVDCARSSLRIEAADDSRASVGCGLCAWLAGAPSTVLDDLSILGRVLWDDGTRNVECFVWLVGRCRGGLRALPESNVPDTLTRALVSQLEYRRSDGDTV